MVHRLGGFCRTCLSAPDQSKRDDREQTRRSGEHECAVLAGNVRHGVGAARCGSALRVEVDLQSYAFVPAANRWSSELTVLAATTNFPPILVSTNRAPSGEPYSFADPQINWSPALTSGQA